VEVINHHPSAHFIGERVGNYEDTDGDVIDNASSSSNTVDVEQQYATDKGRVWIEYDNDDDDANDLRGLSSGIVDSDHRNNNNTSGKSFEIVMENMGDGRKAVIRWTHTLLLVVNAIAAVLACLPVTVFETEMYQSVPRRTDPGGVMDSKPAGKVYNMAVVIIALFLTGFMHLLGTLASWNFTYVMDPYFDSISKRTNVLFWVHNTVFP
jgi:hypothetical protein